MKKAHSERLCHRRRRRRLSFFSPINHIMYLLRFWSSQRIDDGKRVAVFFSLFFAVTQQPPAFILHLNFLCAHETVYSLRNRIIILISTCIQSHHSWKNDLQNVNLNANTHTQTKSADALESNWNDKKKPKHKWNQFVLYVADVFFFIDSICLVDIFCFSHFNIPPQHDQMCMYIRSNAILFALIRVWNYLWKCDEMCNAQRWIQSRWNHHVIRFEEKIKKA